MLGYFIKFLLLLGIFFIRMQLFSVWQRLCTAFSKLDGGFPSDAVNVKCYITLANMEKSRFIKDCNEGVLRYLHDLFELILKIFRSRNFLM